MKEIKVKAKIIPVLIIIVVGVIFAFQSRWFDNEERVQELTKDLTLELVRDELI